MSAQFQPAISFVLDAEDFQRACKVEPDRCPEGCSGPCFAISGINSGVFPTWFSTIQAKTQSERLAAVEDFYQSEFWEPMQLDLLDSQELANQVLDSGVNQGPGTAIRMLQEAINATQHASLTIDGAMGPLTADAANSTPQDALYEAFKTARLDRYAKTSGSPADHAAWIARVNRT